jgi:hypothetical protein
MLGVHTAARLGLKNVISRARIRKKKEFAIWSQRVT